MLLLYCMIPDDASLRCHAVSGVGGAEMNEVAKSGVRYFYSEWRPANGTEELRQQAVEFHRANQKILERATLIPFRFPTHVSNETDLAALMETHSGVYAQELSRLNGMVQMKVTIEGSAHAHTPVTSGTEYLRQRQVANAPMETALEDLQQALTNLVTATKRARRGNASVLFLLIERGRIEAFRSAIAGLGDMPVRVVSSGPWPPSEFVNCYPDPVAKP